MRTFPLVVSALAAVVCFIACSDSASEPPSAAAGSSGSAGAGGESNAAGSAGSGQSAGAAGASGTSGNQPGSPTTSAMCGGVPILGQQGKATTAACNACVETSCCAQGTACGAKAECIPYRNCVGDCVDAACTKTCGESFAAGVAASDAFLGCRNKNCGDVCQDLACFVGPLPMVPTAATYAVTLQAIDFLSGKVVPKMTIKQCKRDDVTCAAPVATATTNDQGDAAFAAVPVDGTGFVDYFEISEATYQPQLVFPTGTSAQPLVDGMHLAVSTLSKSTWSLLLGAAEATTDDTRGHVSFFTNSCSAQGVGMQVAGSTADAGSRTVYLEGGLPSTTAKATDTGGAGAVLNLPPGPATLTSTLASSGQAIGKAHVLVRAGYVTTTNLRPGAE